MEIFAIFFGYNAQKPDFVGATVLNSQHRQSEQSAFHFRLVISLR